MMKWISPLNIKNVVVSTWSPLTAKSYQEACREICFSKLIIKTNNNYIRVVINKGKKGRDHTN